MVKFRCGLVTLLLLPALASAQLAVHPAQVRQNGPWLISVQGEWPNGCGGEIRTQVSASSIDITAVPATGVDICTQVVLPFFELVNPRASSAEVDFGDSVTVNYRYDGELRGSIEVPFSESAAPAERFRTGSWVTSIANHGLFIDQQNDVLTAALFDYDADGQAVWYYAAGKVEGDVYIADMVRYGEIVCVTAPCERVAPVRQGRIELLLTDTDEIHARLVDVLESPRVVGADHLVYRQLDLSRSADLPQPGPGEPALPDLVGEWLGGVQGDGAREDDFQTQVIKYSGLDLGGAVDTHVFSAFAAGEGVPDPAPLLYRIRCDVGQPGAAARCQLEGYQSLGASCAAEFGYSAVGVDRVRSAVHCSSADADYDSVFHLFRLD